MGDPRKLKKKYSTPVHPWNSTEIAENKVFRKEYGLRIRKEILIADSFLKKYKNIAKKLISDETKQGEKEKAQMLEKLQNLGLLVLNSTLDDVLSLELKDILERRLQSVVYRNGLARSMKQSRQFITHRHIMVGKKEINVPSYLVSLQEESQISFKGKSALSDEEHPERINPAKEIKEELEATKKDEIKSLEEKKSAKKVEESEEPKKEVKAEETPKEEPKTEEVKDSKEVTEEKPQEKVEGKEE
jgi:small subunit ribosomal protein S4